MAEFLWDRKSFELESEESENSSDDYISSVSDTDNSTVSALEVESNSGEGFQVQSYDSEELDAYESNSTSSTEVIPGILSYSNSYDSYDSYQSYEPNIGEYKALFIPTYNDMKNVLEENFEMTVDEFTQYPKFSEIVENHIITDTGNGYVISASGRSIPFDGEYFGDLKIKGRKGNVYYVSGMLADDYQIGELQKYSATSCKGYKSSMKICKRGYCSAKKKYKKYPSAYANAYASKVCSGKAADIDGVKKKDKKYSKRVAKDKRSGKDNDLQRWFKEKWVNVCSKNKNGKYKACGRRTAGKKKDYPYCRPSVRVNSKTPKTVDELSDSYLKKLCRDKRKTNPSKGKKPTRVYVKKKGRKKK